MATTSADVPSKTAVDAVVELEGKLDELENDNHRLRINLRLADGKIQNQQAMMNQAAAELENARLEFERLQTEMNACSDELTQLDAQFRMDWAQFHAVMADMEKRLESMLSQCSGDFDTDTYPATDERQSYPNSAEFSGPDDLPNYVRFSLPK